MRLRDVREPVAPRRAQHALSNASTSCSPNGSSCTVDVPVGTVVLQLRPRQGDQQDRRIADRRRERGDQVEQRGLGPLNVVDENDKRGVRHRPRGSTDCPGGLLGSRRPFGEPEQLLDLRGNDIAVRLASATCAAIRRRASMDECSSSIPASSRTIWPTAQYVMPSPYERHVPRTTRARVPIRVTNSETRRDLPTPGSPMTVTSRHSGAPTFWNSRSSKSSCSLRPVKDAPTVRGAGPKPLISRRR